MVVDDATRDILLGIGLSEVRDIVAREADSRNDLEQALLKGMVTFGRAALASDFSERIVWYCAGLESILLRGSDQIVSSLSERLALFGYDTVGERLAAVKDVKRFLTQMCARFSPSRSAAPWEEGADALVPANQR